MNATRRRRIDPYATGVNWPLTLYVCTSCARPTLFQEDKCCSGYVWEVLVTPMTEIEHWLHVEKGIWRVEFSRRPPGMRHQVEYVETTENATEEEVRRWQSEGLPSNVHVVEVRRATIADVNELEEMAGA